MYGYICKECGAHLDPNERCDCIEERKIKETEKNNRNMTTAKLLDAEWVQERFQFCCS